jgi:Zn-dependent M28 family amino/carboxypeptidase
MHVEPPEATWHEGTWPDGASARGYIESYIMTHPFRVAGDGYDSLGTMARARDSLVGLLEGFGNLSVVRHDYEGGQNILAFKNGTTHPEQWVVLSAHYDSVGVRTGTTVYGAWDNGAGTAALIELARAMADWQMPFTVVFAFFDGEEKGLVGSGHFVQDYFVEAGVDIVANLNTDPPGLNWPCGDAAGAFPVKVIHELDKVAMEAESPQDRFTWLYAAVESALAATKVPDEVRDYTPGIPIAQAGGQGLRGGSDHLRFGAEGIANVYLGGTPTTRAPNDAAAALTYPLHTPLDTLAAMDARCASGGPASTLAGGLQTILDIFAHSLAWMSDNPAPARL